ncbi:ADP-ribosylglycohydrolase family protein [Pseudomonas aeruginosa]
MLGAIAGDIVGSYWEFLEEKDRNADLFVAASTITDDSILTLATAEAIMRNSFYSDKYQQFARMYPNYGYGPNFMQWAQLSTNYVTPNNSFGNGSAMRVSPIGWAFNDLQRVMQEAQLSACITHSHPEGIKGATATATAVYMARRGYSKDEILEVMTGWFDYDIPTDLDHLNETYRFDVTCQGTIPVAIACVMQGNSYEEVLRNGLHTGGDSDTLLCIAGSIAEPLFGIPQDIREKTEMILHMHSPVLLGIMQEFERQYGCGKHIPPTDDFEAEKIEREKSFFKRLLSFRNKP